MVFVLLLVITALALIASVPFAGRGACWVIDRIVESRNKAAYQAERDAADAEWVQSVVDR